MTAMKFNDEPLLVVIAEVNERQGDWDIQVPRNAHAEIERRIGLIQKRIRDEAGENAKVEAQDPIGGEWRMRKVNSAVMEGESKDVPNAPHFKTHPEHKPIVVREGDRVRFTCAWPFKIWAYREPRVEPKLESPENPFGWARTQEVTKKGLGGFELEATAVGGLKAQRFYKCVAWVTVGEGTVLVDPDCIGD